ncbi:MAG: c-type cytochrome [Candidatus Competibacterales bacterium]
MSQHAVHEGAAQQDRQLYITMVAVLSGLALVSVVIFLLAQLISLVSGPEVGTSERAQTVIANRLAPVGAVVVGEPAPPAAETQVAAAAPPAAEATPVVYTADLVDKTRGEEVYGQVCLACHMTGAAGAPKTDDQGAWQTRAEQGFSTLVHHAIQGINAMPARGGNPNLTDADIASSVAYILDEAGVSYEVPSTSEAAEASAAAQG